MKLIRVVAKKTPSALERNIVQRTEVPNTREYDKRVDFDPEPISYEALDTRLNDALQMATHVGYRIFTSRRTLEQEYKGGGINIVMRELRSLEALLSSALTHAESVADQIKREGHE